MAKGERKRIDLALQGGGSHGALTWGVLDRLLEENRLEIDGISGTSAGAMNAVVLADGLHKGGRDGARAALHAFWKAVSDAARFSPIQRSPWDRLMGNDSLDHSPSYLLFESLTQLIAPAKLNPLAINPLRDLVIRLVDFERVNACRKVKLFVTATNVRTGKVKVFSNDEISIDAVMASACLPFLFQAVEIDGEAYWDGGYMGNPAIFPLIYSCDTPDVLVVHINPLERTELPRTAAEILNRINEISFNSSLLREMRAIAFVTQLIDSKAGNGLDLLAVADREAGRFQIFHVNEGGEGSETKSEAHSSARGSDASPRATFESTQKGETP